MPATRVHSPSVSTPRERHDRNHRTQKKAPNEAEVIVLSSDDESPIAGATKGHLNKSRLLSRKKKKAILRPAALVLGDVLEISDSDGAQSSSGTTACKTENGAVESLKRTVASLEQVISSFCSPPHVPVIVCSPAYRRWRRPTNEERKKSLNSRRRRQRK